MLGLVPAKVKVWFELSLHSVKKHVIVIFLESKKKLFVCACVCLFVRACAL